VGKPGSVTDSTAWKTSKLFKDRHVHVPSGYWLALDKGYGLYKEFVTPFKEIRGAAMPWAQRRFNLAFSRTRVFIERAFGMLKARFRILLNRSAFDHLATHKLAITVCFILHNMCVAQNVPLLPDDAALAEELMRIRAAFNVSLGSYRDDVVEAIEGRLTENQRRRANADLEEGKARRQQLMDVSGISAAARIQGGIARRRRRGASRSAPGNRGRSPSQRGRR
jgi:hypothetical protein